MTPAQLAKSGTEHGHQRALFAAVLEWSRVVYDMMYAIPNGGSRGDTDDSRKIRGNMLKTEGVKDGVPDVKVAWPYGNYAGLYIEMKRPADRDKKRAKGKVADAQEAWHTRLREHGYAVEVAYTWEEAFAAIKRYFGVTD